MLKKTKKPPRTISAGGGEHTKKDKKKEWKYYFGIRMQEQAQLMISPAGAPRLVS